MWFGEDSKVACENIDGNIKISIELGKVDDHARIIHDVKASARIYEAIKAMVDKLEGGDDPFGTVEYAKEVLSEHVKLTDRVHRALVTGLSDS